MGQKFEKPDKTCTSITALVDTFCFRADDKTWPYSAFLPSPRKGGVIVLCSWLTHSLFSRFTRTQF